MTVNTANRSNQSSTAPTLYRAQKVDSILMIVHNIPISHQ